MEREGWRERDGERDDERGMEREGWGERVEQRRERWKREYDNLREGWGVIWR